MPSWSEILTQVDLYSNPGVELDKKRVEYINKIYSITNRNIIAYYSNYINGYILTLYKSTVYNRLKFIC